MTYPSLKCSLSLGSVLTLDSISCVRWYLLSQKHVERIREEYLVDLRKRVPPYKCGQRRYITLMCCI